jgi:membrane associated rhomboid family serine protease
MFLPLGDEPNPRHQRPWVNWGLIAANVAYFLFVRASAGGDDRWADAVRDQGLVPADPAWIDFFTSMFMHADWMHLLGNMLFLWIFGDNVEGRLGHLGYLFAYLACGLAAVLLFMALSAGSATPLVGASGAIFGVQGFYFVAFRGNRVKVLVWFLVLSMVWIPARVMLGISFLTNLFLMLRPVGEAVGGGVAYAAHVGGALLGAAMALGIAGLEAMGAGSPPPRAP